jgi:hypothetical protein
MSNFLSVPMHAPEKWFYGVSLKSFGSNSAVWACKFFLLELRQQLTNMKIIFLSPIKGISSRKKVATLKYACVS